MNTTLDLHNVIQPHEMASQITDKWNSWNTLRKEWVDQKRELRNYLYAVDTTTTSNKKLPWSNSTTTPKLTQIYDNLKANYTAALFPNSKWMRWEGEDSDAVTKGKRDVVEAYMNNKVRQSNFQTVMDRLVDDYILYGNCFATVTFETNYTEVNGEMFTGYVGPRVVRISPHDIVFNPVSAEFRKTPKIIRSILTLGEAKKRMEPAVFKRLLSNRAQVGSAPNVDKADGFIADGFSTIQHYYGSDYVEILTFYGDIYDKTNDALKENVEIQIVDRAYVIHDEPIASWLGSAPVFHAGWRSRPDNLYAMGPLDNLVGMQYRIDHLENLKADVFDQIALPIQKIRGDVEDYTYEPGAKIIMGEEGDVTYLVPDATALQADFQIRSLEDKMEELAGAPRQAMGIRTPGEKTAYEVQTLQNSAGRIFQNKASKLEIEFIEPILNAMLESARRNMDTSDLIRVLDDETGAILFQQITKEDITAKGKIVPVGARHFAERAQRVQDITTLTQTKATIQDVGVHLSGKKIAELLAFELGEPSLYGENIAVQEGLETQQASQNAEASNMENLAVAQEIGI